ncbi:YczE/YyaS/YitT family protein [Clostridium cylindrosporum]|uniref:Putative membrane protein YczE n=1 Tax=Clostridium cylindrosporum DSM 605 TaxID=1121307 RepID=A0A0J8G2V2_CLOCY|nr:membrane protein [Clostridium cylindrosporum]KMT22026.1 putative membrane protein YczE [Clostridium cylindrosporum DSM 605]
MEEKSNEIIDDNKEKKNSDIVDTHKETALAYIIRVMVFVGGIFVLALGAATSITANLGVATWDVLHIGLSNLSGLSVGRWVQIVGIIMVLTTCILEREKPAIGSILNILIVGYFLNLILDLGFIPNFTEILPRSILLLIGIVLMGTGSGMYVASKVGAGPRDGMTLYLSKRFSISVRLARTILEISALTIGWLIGGPVAIGTFLSVPLVGPVMQASLRFWMKQLTRLPKTSN